jgi:hypothetical protein
MGCIGDPNVTRCGGSRVVRRLGLCLTGVAVALVLLAPDTAWAGRTAHTAGFIPAFKVAVDGTSVLGHRGLMRVTTVELLGAREGETAFVACFSCKGLRNTFVPFPIRHSGRWFHRFGDLYGSAHSLFTVALRASGAAGRYKEYTLNPSLRANRLKLEGCIASNFFIYISCSGASAVEVLGPPVVPAPACSPCQVLSHISIFQRTIPGTSNAMEVKQDGVIVGFKMSLRGESLGSQEAANTAYGGPPSLALTVLRPTVATDGSQAFTMAIEGFRGQLRPYLGKTDQIIPETPGIPVAIGDRVGLNIPTWAPIITTVAGAQVATPLGTGGACLLGVVGIGEVNAFTCSYEGLQATYDVLVQPR